MILINPYPSLINPSCKYYSLAMDESTAAQLAIFIKTINYNFEIAEELLDVCHMKGKTTGKDALKELTTVMEKYELSEEKLCSVTTDGAKSLAGKNIGFLTLLQKQIKKRVSPFPLYHPPAAIMCKSFKIGSCKGESH